VCLDDLRRALVEGEGVVCSVLAVGWPVRVPQVDDAAAQRALPEVIPPVACSTL
jgi:hypothetical protein